ncbi:ABC transporter permease [Actinomadura decatromicini]|uniref:ABC transporter permease n=1 Tax=Actinomadura decatromicini TaxID=2604572 RepID=A0A5D3FNA2_9ACTN|nr:ABC transporter permease [Actinomadura decatromicini]TYK49494.1 ABC transporter permease [Actinomadura decatromicini]
MSTTTTRAGTRRVPANPAGRAALRRAPVAVAGILVILVAWELVARAYGKPLLFPGPAETGSTLLDGLTGGDIPDAAVASIGRVLSGLAIGSLAGVLLGLLSGSSRVLEALFEPFINVFRFIPPLAWFAPALLWLGAGETSKVALIVYTSVFVVAVNTAAGVKAVPKNMVRMARTYGAGPVRVFFAVRLPASLPYIFSGVRIAMGNAFMTVVTAEMLGAESGLGVLITEGTANTDVRGVFAALIVLGALGLCADRLFVLLLRRFGGRFSARTLGGP